MWGTKKTLRFGLLCGSTYYIDEGPFTEMPGTTRSNFMAIGLKDWCAPRLYDYAVGAWFQGPYVT
jgi:hypothetical protein